jgi:voltage-gated potassium channel
MPSLDKQFQRVRTAIVGRRLTDLPSARLAGIEEHLTQQARQTLGELEQIEREADEAIAAHDWLRFDGLRVRAIELSDQFEETRALTKKVENARHERLLEERLVTRFGSARAVMVWDLMIMGLIILVVTLLIIQDLIGVDDRTALIFDVIDVAACMLFFVDLFFRFRAAESGKWFIRRYWLDVITSIPIPTSVLRAGRVVRLARLARMVRLVRLLRVVRVILFFWRGMDKLAATLDVKLMRRSLNILVGVLLVGGVCIWWVEGSAEGVEDLSQGLWWSFTTVVTGGFGDIHNPSSMLGRLLTVLLVIAGMVVVGMFTATLTSVLVREEDTTSALLSFEQGVHEELGRIHAQLAQLTAGQGGAAQAEAGPLDQG